MPVPSVFGQPAMSLSRVATGFSRPVFGTVAPGDSGRMFVVEQRWRANFNDPFRGRIRILNLGNGTINSVSFLEITDILVGSSGGDERGLLGLAFHPDYVQNGLFYVHFVNSTGNTEIREYARLNDNQADASSGRTLLIINQDFANHNGGWLGFGPDGFLYIATGDGGAGFDPFNRAQNKNSLLGKLLRIDPLGNNSSNGQYGIPTSNPFVGIAGVDEIWAYGLRNPWRCSFDALTGDLYIADVGQGEKEEINVQPASSMGGENYGWRVREGTIATPKIEDPDPAGAIDPIHDYDWDLGFQPASVTGGCVYRGPISQLQGHYFFADYVKDRIWSLKWDGSDPSTHDGSNYTNFVEWTNFISTTAGTVRSISSFANDEVGNLYIFDLAGEVFRVDEAMFASGDMNGDNAFNNGDISAFVLALTNPADFAAQYPNVNLIDAGDLNGDGVFNNGDIAAFINALIN